MSEELRLRCSDCETIFNDWGESRCLSGHRYIPTVENENCPNCGCEEYDEMCPNCHDGILFYADEIEVEG